MEIKIGCCGWGFFRPANYFGKDWKKRFGSTLQAYAKLFSLVEVNTTFYRLPKLETAEKWYEEAKEINENFEFTVKCSKIVTHEDGFRTKASNQAYEATRKIAKALGAKILLLQTPASFKPTPSNLRNLKHFISKINRRGITLVWEPRGKAWEDGLLLKLCKSLNLVHCVDPLRRDPVYFSRKRIAYFRLHGFGKRSMYSYKFSKTELKDVLKKIEDLEAKVKSCYVLFNNIYMYEDAIEFLKLIS